MVIAIVAVSFKYAPDQSNLACQINHIDTGSESRKVRLRELRHLLLQATCAGQVRVPERLPTFRPGKSTTARDCPMHKLTLNALVIIASTAAASGALAQDAAKGDPAAGKTSFNKCLACHSIGEGAKNKVGPELNGLDGRKSGSAPDYSYSDANKNSGITWNEAQFKDYIKDPKAKVPGTKMIFPGIKNENEVNNLWAYISQFDADGKVKSN
jgi:cytochrome c